VPLISKELISVDDVEAFIDRTDYSIIGYVFRFYLLHVVQNRGSSKYEQNQGYDKWRMAEGNAEGCKMAVWVTLWYTCW